MNNSYPRINEEVAAILKQTKAEPAFVGTIKEGCERKYTIINDRDVAKYVDSFTQNELAIALDNVCSQIEHGRESDGKVAFNNYIVVNVDEPYINDIVAVLENNEHWDGLPSNNMKFYEVHEPCYALIMASNVEDALKAYVETVAEDDGTLREEIECVGSAYAVARFSRARGEDKELVDLQEILETLDSCKTKVLLVDGLLL
ncbi:hypothetical protein [Lysinibacillus sp. RC79]|uniref:hypothetical protein n=1 Tax=Lysinibacillus sp. RC79 TaxID=3156296 RepID=UPI003513D3F0